MIMATTPASATKAYPHRGRRGVGPQNQQNAKENIDRRGGGEASLEPQQRDSPMWIASTTPPIDPKRIRRVDKADTAFARADRASAGYVISGSVMPAHHRRRQHHRERKMRAGEAEWQRSLLVSGEAGHQPCHRVEALVVQRHREPARTSPSPPGPRREIRGHRATDRCAGVSTAAEGETQDETASISSKAWVEPPRTRLSMRIHPIS